MPKRYHAAEYGHAAAAMRHEDTAAVDAGRAKFVRWATEKDSQYFYPGFEPNHRALREKRQVLDAVRYYDPTAYGVVGDAAAAAGAGGGRSGNATPRGPPGAPCAELALRMREESAQLAAGLPADGVEPVVNLNELVRGGAQGMWAGGGTAAAPPPTAAPGSRRGDASSTGSPARAARGRSQQQQQPPPPARIVYDKRSSTPAPRPAAESPNGRAAATPRKCETPTHRRAATPKVHPRPYIAGKHEKDHNKNPRRLGREVPNSAFNRPFHAYGWKNTRPSTSEEYMKTHNVKASRKERYAHGTARRSRSINYQPPAEVDAPADPAPAPASVLKAASVVRTDVGTTSIASGALGPPGPEVEAYLNASGITARSDAQTLGMTSLVVGEGASVGGGQARGGRAAYDADKTILINRKMRLTVRKTDSAKLLESSVRLALGIPAHLPLLLLDAQERPVTLSYDALCNGEELCYDAARVAAHFAYVMDQTLANNRFYFLQRHVPSAGKRVERGDRAADCFA